MGILKLLIFGRNDDSSFWVCGDYWQSIYAFTGASVENILRFGTVFKNSKQFILDMNYRSTQSFKSCYIHQSQFFTALRTIISNTRLTRRFQKYFYQLVYWAESIIFSFIKFTITILTNFHDAHLKYLLISFCSSSMRIGSSVS